MRCFRLKARPGFDTQFFARLEELKAGKKTSIWQKFRWATVSLGAVAATAALLLTLSTEPDGRENLDMQIAMELELLENLEVIQNLEVLKLYKARDKYKVRSRFSTYLFRIATNHCINLQARRDNKLVDRHKPVEDRQIASPDQVDKQFERKRLRELLSRTLGALPDNQRSAMVLCHYEGMSYREAAESLDVSESSVKSLIHRARARLMQELGGVLNGQDEESHAV